MPIKTRTNKNFFYAFGRTSDPKDENSITREIRGRTYRYILAVGLTPLAYLSADSTMASNQGHGTDMTPTLNQNIANEPQPVRLGEILLAQATAGGRGTPTGGGGGPAPGPAAPGPAAPGPSAPAGPAAAGPSAAGPTGLGTPGEGKVGGLLDLLNAPDVGLSDGRTSLITNALANIAETCETLPGEYRIDCLGKGMTLLANSMGNDVEYAEIRKELEDTGRSLRKIAKQNQDPTKPRIKRVQSVNAGKSKQRSRSYRPIKEVELPKATEAAIAIIQESQTRLLRSAENSERRRVHYQTVTRSLDSATRILRS